MRSFRQAKIFCRHALRAEVRRARIIAFNTVRTLEVLVVPLVLVAGALIVGLVLFRAATWMDMAVKMPDVERIKAENDSMRTLTQVFGGAFVLVGLYFSAKSIAISKRDQASDRVGDAMAALGSTSEAQRVGAITVLADILSRPSKDYYVARTTLSAFVRSQTGDEIYRSKHRDGPSVDVQAALNALGGRGWGSRCAPRQQRILDLRNTFLVGVDLRDGYFAGADFGHSNLSSANLHNATLTQVRFTGVTATRASFVQADLRKATFYQATADGAAFREALLDDSIFTRADLRDASFAGTTLIRVSFSNATLVGTSFDDAQQIACDFVHAKREESPGEPALPPDPEVDLT
jgi:hypothetical protein